MLKQIVKRTLRAFGLRLVHVGAVFGDTDYPEIIKSQVTQAEPVIFDIGANNGQSAAIYRKIFPRAQIHAFEPDPKTFEVLSRKFSDDPRCHLNNCGVSDQNGVLLLQQNSRHATNSFLKLKDVSEWRANVGAFNVGSVEVPVITLDEYCQREAIHYIDILKLDTQGYEPQCLAGASCLLGEKRVGILRLELILSDFYEKSLTFSEIEKYLVPNGYKLISVFDIAYRQDATVLQLEALYKCDSRSDRPST